MTLRLQMLLKTGFGLEILAKTRASADAAHPGQLKRVPVDVFFWHLCVYVE